MPGPVSPLQECCSPDCDPPVSVQVPGPAGTNGVDGDDGDDGVSSFTTTTAQFLMPAEGGSVSVLVGNTSWMVPGQLLYVQTAGNLRVVSKTNSTTVVLSNPENTATGAYAGNAAPTTAIPASSLVSPGGEQGQSGALTGAAGGDLEGTYPSPRTAITTTLGDIIVNNNNAVAPRNTRLARGADGSVLHSDGTQATGRRQSGIDLLGLATLLLNALGIANGGTGGTTALAGFNNLSPLTTRGDILTRNATNNIRFALGAINTVVGSDGTDRINTKVTSAMMDATAKFQGRYGVLGSITVDLNAAAGSDQSFTINSARYLIHRVIIEAATVTLAASAARIGLYTNPAKAGTVIVTDPNSELTNLTSSLKWRSITHLVETAGSDLLTATTLYVHLSAAHGVAATLKLWIEGLDLST